MCVVTVACALGVLLKVKGSDRTGAQKSELNGTNRHLLWKSRAKVVQEIQKCHQKSGSASYLDAVQCLTNGESVG